MVVIETYIIISVFLVEVQAVLAILYFGRLEAAFRRWRWRRQHQFLGPVNIPGSTPREIMKERSIPPLDISKLRGLRIDDYGQLTESPSLLYFIADDYDKEMNKIPFKPSKSKSAETSSDVDGTAMQQTGHPDANHRKFLAEMERHANKLRRRYELETYNARRSNFKRFATDRMIGLGRHRFAFDPSATDAEQPSMMSI